MVVCCSVVVVKEEIKKEMVTKDDLADFMKLVDGKDGGPAWQSMMDKSIPGMIYQAWRREPEVSLLLMPDSESSLLKRSVSRF